MSPAPRRDTVAGSGRGVSDTTIRPAATSPLSPTSPVYSERPGADTTGLNRLNDRIPPSPMLKNPNAPGPVVEFASSKPSVATALSTCVPVRLVPNSFGSAGARWTPGVKNVPDAEKLKTGEPANTVAQAAVAHTVVDNLIASRSNPLNWPGDPPSPALLSAIVMEEMADKPSEDKSARNTLVSAGPLPVNPVNGVNVTAIVAAHVGTVPKQATTY